MSFDNSRISFDPWKDYSGVVMEQGRVQTDADLNEISAEIARRIQAGTLDTLGRAVYPLTTPFGFAISPSTSGGSVTIGRGRMYVDGILVENHGDPTKGSWDPALAEWSGSPQPPPASDAAPVAYEQQPYVYGATFPTTPGDYLVYLDAWKQPVSYIEDPSLIDSAIGVDTSGRLKTVWRLNTMPVAAGSTCMSAAPQWPVSAGQLSNGTVTSGPSGPCCLTTGSGYAGVENQFYRVEIQAAGAAGGTGATFKWSRENASVQTTVTAVTQGANSVGDPASKLTVASVGRDQVLAFAAGNWVEISNETNDNLCQPGMLYKIDSVDVASLTITLTTLLPSGFSVTPTATNAYTRLVRWDQSGKVYKSDNKTVWCDLDVVGSGGPLDAGFYGIPVPTDGSGLVLENGIVVTFGLSSASGSYLPMDYWNFSARAATGLIDTLMTAPPRGLHHHYAQLAIATVGASGTVTSVPDCRMPWPPERRGRGLLLYLHGRRGRNVQLDQRRHRSLPDHGGEICILPGDYYENVLLQGKHNVVIHGCEWQTRVFSQSLDPSGAVAGQSTRSAAQSGLAAVFTIVDCENIELCSLAVKAAKDEVGILLDRASTSYQAPAADASGFSVEHIDVLRGRGDRDVILEDLIVEASTLPAIIAVSVEELKIDDCRIYMEDVDSLWAAVFLSGVEIFFTHNMVGLGSAIKSVQRSKPAGTQLPTIADVRVDASFSTRAKAAQKSAKQTSNTTETVLASFKAAEKAPGGIHIAGPSKNVFVVENEITGGTGNGITLGSFIILDKNGADTGTLTGVKWEVEDPCAKTVTGGLPGSVSVGTSGTSKIGASGPIINLHIERNTIKQMGLAGIGVVGFWNLREVLEVISIENLSIVENVIARTMMRTTASINTKTSGFGYGAISLAAVQNLMIRDNIITDFGAKPGAQVCGIFVLHGEMVEISRNQIRETRDWGDTSYTGVNTPTGTRAGILMLLVTPPALSSVTGASAAANTGAAVFSSAALQQAKPIYEAALPALRVQENVVRVALGLALEVFGYGPFAIGNNHFGSGGPVTVNSNFTAAGEYLAPSKNAARYADPLLVLILNLGLAIEGAKEGNSFTALYAAQNTAEVGETSGLASAGGGAVMFNNNQCQLQARDSGVAGSCSVEILSLDDLLFISNHLWLDGVRVTALTDLIALAATLQVCDNRFQEGPLQSVIYSGLTVGLANITTQNIATYCLKVAAPAGRKYQSPNVILIPTLCRSALKRADATVDKAAVQLKGK